MTINENTTKEELAQFIAENMAIDDLVDYAAERILSYYEKDIGSFEEDLENNLGNF